MTDVTLRQGTGYRVSFVDPTNATQVLAQSADFEVKAPGSMYLELVPSFLTSNLTLFRRSIAGAYHCCHAYIWFS